MPVHGIWIIDSAGLCIFHKNYSNINIDPQLFSGFFTALVQFSTEINKVQLERIVLGYLDISYTNDRGIHFVVCTNKGESAIRILRGIRETFSDHFKDEMIVLSDMLRDGPGLSLLNRFEKELDRIVGYAPDAEFRPSRYVSITRVLKRGSEMRNTLERKFGTDGIAIMLLCDGSRAITDIADELNIPEEEVAKIVDFGVKEKILGTMRVRSDVDQVADQSVL
ncbi:MAG: hypothetical protein ACFE7E_00185 [Candidatus Hodarchaeota archaeon]